MFFTILQRLVISIQDIYKTDSLNFFELMLFIDFFRHNEIRLL